MEDTLPAAREATFRAAVDEAPRSFRGQGDELWQVARVRERR